MQSTLSALVVLLLLVVVGGASSHLPAYLTRPVLTDAEFQEAYAASVAAAAQRGVVLAPAVEYRRGRWGAAYFATERIAAGTSLITVPLDVSFEFADIRRRFPDLDEWAAHVQVNGDRSLYALALALPDPATQLRPLVTWMSPRACVNTVTFAGKVMRDAKLAAPVLRQLSQTLRGRAASDYARLQQHAPHHLGNVSRVDYRLAYCWFETRSFGPRAGVEGSASLLPIADLPNHAQVNAPMSWTYDEARAAWVFYATRDIEAGEEIMCSYGDDKTSEQLLVSYGFATRDNANDVFNVPVESALLRSTAWLQATQAEPHFRADDEWRRLLDAAVVDFNQTLRDLTGACDRRVAAIDSHVHHCNAALATNRDPSPQIPGTLHALLSFYDAERVVVVQACASLKRALILSDAHFRRQNAKK